MNVKYHFASILIFWFSIAYCQNNNSELIVEIDSIPMNNFSTRALIPEEDRVWFAANKGRFGYHDFKTNTTFEKRITFDSLMPEFRSIAATSGHIFILSISNPALLYKIDKQTNIPRKVYYEQHANVFYDSMKFWNESEGIAIGDPIDGCFSIIITRDGGNTWRKLACDSLPEIAEGEAAFAASNTNIVVKGDKCWIVSGGKKARVLHSPDKGKTWKVYDTPIIQGEQMTGIYTADFYDENIGFIAGGNYNEPDSSKRNKAITVEGGKTWKLMSNNTAFGYASCVQYVPGSNGLKLVSVGATGLWHSSDGGESWQKLLDDKMLYTISFLDDETAYAAGRNKIIRIRFKK